MDVFILTAVRRGVASLAIPRLVESERHRIVAVVVTEEQIQNKWKRVKRRVKKIARIGVSGAINGLRMRRWFFEEPADMLGMRDVADVAAEHGVPMRVVPAINCDETRTLIRSLNADLGLSLGNSYIGRSVFSIPKFGMINIHHEILPQFRGAQSVLWQLHEGSDSSGYTVHQIDASIDNGAILYQEPVPIDVRPTLHETVAATCATLYARSVDGLLRVLDTYEELAAVAKPQGAGRSFTTPSLRQYLRMARNHRALLARRSQN
jgi:methionyl-tRNA formyltransferase